MTFTMLFKLVYLSSFMDDRRQLAALYCVFQS